MNNILRLILAIILSIGFSKVHSQVSRSEIIGGYIYNFGNKISWPNSFDNFIITIISSDEEVIKELQKMAQSEKIHNKKIKLNVLSKPDASKIIKSNLVFITEDKLDQYMTVFDTVEGYEILLISENFENKAYIMLNLFDTDENKILFEINRPNIINQKLSISDEVLLMGGSEIDIADIYLKSQRSLRQMEKSEIVLKQDLKKQHIALENMTKQVKEGQQNLQKQQATIVEQRDELALLAQSTDSLNKNIENQMTLLKQEQNKLQPIKDSLTNAKDALSEQLVSLEAGKIRLNKQREKIDDMNMMIERKDQELGQSASTIERQQQVVLIFGGLILFIVVLLIAVIIEYRKNRKKNALLRTQKEELNQTIAQLRTTQEKLVQSEKMASLGVLTAGIAHEINNPVNFVYTGTSNLKQEFEDLNVFLKEIDGLNVDVHNAEEWIEKIIKLKDEYEFSEIYSFLPQIIDDVIIGAERITEIVKGLRNFSRMDLDDYSDSDVHKIIKGSLILLKNELREGITLEETYDESIPLIECNFGKISQVVLNILNNAIAATGNEGKITISTRHDNTMVFISIKDDGKGIQKEVQEKIFDPFFTTKQVGEGTGLGLSISYGIVKEHGGNIKVISEENIGTEFIISLPINRTE